MKWIHILDQRPDANRYIVRLEKSDYEDEEWHISMRKALDYKDWAKSLEYFKEHDCVPDYFWIYKEDFCLPNKEQK